MHDEFLSELTNAGREKAQVFVKMQVVIPVIRTVIASRSMDMDMSMDHRVMVDHANDGQ